MTTIDTSFDFTTDSPHYWEAFWGNKGGRGGGNLNTDPDAVSPTLRKYHQILWSKILPCGVKMELDDKLSWNGFWFASDSISVGHRYKRMERILEEFKKTAPDYKAYVEDFIHKSYTIGGMMIWPCRRNSINQTKGCNTAISDRMDRTLECIRRFYLGEPSPMSECLEIDRKFFELFVDFKGFVDFFFLQDLVADDYQSVRMLIGNSDLSTPALAQTVDEYRLWLERQLEFVKNRNERISKEFSACATK